MKENREAMKAEALERATTSQAMTNYGTIYAEFEARGISDIRPRENVFTFWAWQALGRKVKRGEHGVRIVTWIPCTSKELKEDPKTGEMKANTYKRAKTAVVFHESQTEPMQAVEDDSDDPLSCENQTSAQDSRRFDETRDAEAKANWDEIEAARIRRDAARAAALATLSTPGTRCFC